MHRCAFLLLFANSLFAAEFFDYHSGFWINLHHFLYQQATNAKESKPVAGGELTGDAARNWQAAIAYYRASVIEKDLLFDDGLTAVKTSLGALEKADTLRGSAVPAELAEVLETVSAVYRAHWWPQHDKSNQAWIAAAKPLVTKYGPAVSARLALLYQTPWQSAPIRVDVTVYGSWAGAYTSLHPTHIVITSAEPDYQGTAALEMLFHESSHALISKVSNAINAEAGKQDKWLPGRRDLWHALLFYAVGEVVRQEVDGSYVPFLYGGLFERAWPFYQAGLEKEWKPYIDGKVNLEEAIPKLITAVGIEPKR